MATIITVHGTGATGPEEGQAWWQRGSSFEKHIRELVESEDGALTFQPLVWDGANSETSRRLASGKLYEAAQQQEGKGQPYCLVGHSHGGSVAANALLLGAKKTNKLPGLRRWITIGTPFVKTARTTFLFSRLGVVGKAAYISIMTMIIVILILLTYEQTQKPLDINMWLGVTVLVFLPVALVYMVAIWFNSRRLYMYGTSKQRYADEHFSPLWIPLFHRNDEAIQGLRSLRRVRITLFRRDFAVSFFSFGSLFAVPLGLIFLAMSPTIINFIYPYVPEVVKADRFVSRDGQLIGAGRNILVNLELLSLTPVKYLEVTFGMFSAVAFFILFPLCSLLLSILILYLTRVTAGVISRILSVILNRLTGRQIRMLAFGADTEGEIPLEAQERPPWTSRFLKPLPDPLGSEISNVSNVASSQSVAKFRNALDRIALREGEDVKEEILSGYLTWDELIHCSYFSVPRFRMLVAYAIAHSPGFRPSAVFKSHLDYELVARWYEEIQPKSLDAAASALPVSVPGAKQEFHQSI